MFTRRGFFKLTAAGMLALDLHPKVDSAPRLFAQIPGGTLDPSDIPKYQTPLLIPPVMPRAGTIKQKGGKNIDDYEISMRQFAQQILPAGWPMTTVWGYGAVTAANKNVFEYPNQNRASTIWYHDHALGMTRLNVYAGPAGFYSIRGGPDDGVIDSRPGLVAVLPGPAPKEGDKFPPNKTYYEILIAIQDRSFNADGSLFYPDTRAFFDEIAGPYIPETDISPIWNPEFFATR